MNIKNGQINAIVNFLDTMTLKGRQSLGRTKLKEKLIEKNEVFGKDQQEIIDEYDAWIDKEQLQYKLPDGEAKETMTDLLNQEVEITYNSPFRKDFVKAIEEYEGELDGQHADAYALLYEKLIENKGEDK
jgi:hypothetical protein